MRTHNYNAGPRLVRSHQTQAFSNYFPRFLVASFLLTTGCSPNGDRVKAPIFSPQDAAQQAMALYDTNRDGLLDEKELDQCPGLKSALATADLNGDKRLNVEEIASRLTAHQQANIGIMAVSCKVTLDNNPLSGARVRLVPEAFLGPSFQSASGVSDAMGAVDLRIEGSGFSGLQCGFYRVLITKDGANGKELLPARYNTQTTLGAEVAPDMRSGLVFTLTSDK
jgi:hypothetical protein